jgi:hypothetical protein
MTMLCTVIFIFVMVMLSQIRAEAYMLEVDESINTPPAIGKAEHHLSEALCEYRATACNCPHIWFKKVA